MTCQIELINAGGAYPRSCPTCQLGPCKKGLPHPFAPKPTDTKVQTPTPRVDASGARPNDLLVLARTLERELTALTAELEEARKRIAGLQAEIDRIQGCLA